MGWVGNITITANKRTWQGHKRLLKSGVIFAVPAAAKVGKGDQIMVEGRKYSVATVRPETPRNETLILEVTNSDTGSRRQDPATEQDAGRSADQARKAKLEG